MALATLRKTVHKVPFFEAGRIEGEAIENVVHEYLYEFQIFSHAVDQFKVDRKVVSEMFLHLDELLLEISKDWNSNRPLLDVKEGSSSSVQISDEKLSVSASENAVVTGKLQKLNEEGVQRGKLVGGSGTPSKIEKKITFKRTSPKSELLSKIECNLCNRSYNSLKALKKHLKVKHGGAEVDEELKEVSHRITCRVCLKKQTRDLMNRHLKECHGMIKPYNGSILRGWFSVDDVIWKPLWLLPNEQDPPEVIMVPLNSDGTFTLFGFTFENKSKKPGDEAPDEKSSCNTIEELSEVREYDESEENSEDHPVASSSVVKDSKVIEDSDKTDFENQRQPQVSFSCVNVDSHLNQDEKSMSLGEKVVVVVPSIENPAVDTTGPCGGDAAEKDITKCDLEEILDIAVTTELDQVETGCVHVNPKVVRNLMDAFCSDEENAENDDLLDMNGSLRSNKQKVKVKVFETYVNGGEFWSVEKEQNDSDYEENDSMEYSQNRIRMKEERKLKRNHQGRKTRIIDIENNRTVIEEFENFLKKQKKDSTIRKAMGHLFSYPDSFLQFETALDSKFNLKRLLNPLDDDFLELPDPTTVDGWFQEGCGLSGENDPIRCRERLKHHANFRDFLIEKLRNAEFGRSAEAYYKKDMIIKNLEQISTIVKTKQLYNRIKKSEDDEKAERERARQVLFPSSVHNETVAVSKWYESDEAKSEEQACLKIYKSVVKDKKEVSARNFTRFGQWSKFSVWLADKNRRSAYSFTNLEFKERRPKWLPNVKTQEENLAEVFNKIPDDWDSSAPEKADDPPTCWVIEVSGKGLKGGNRANIILTRKSAEICEKYRDIKGEVFVDGEDDSSPFFVNLKKRPLTEIQRTPGSLMEKFGKVCGVNKATVNTLR